MKEQEVFDMFKSIDAKLDRLAECRIDDLKHINAALEKKANSDQVDEDLKETRSMMKWMAGGAAAALLVLFGYTVVIKADVSKLQTTMIGVHPSIPGIDSMVKGDDK